MLKARTKPVQIGKKRKKIEAIGTFSQYKDSKSKAQTMAPGPMLIQPPQIMDSEGQEMNPDNLGSIFTTVKGKTKKVGKMMDE